MPHIHEKIDFTVEVFIVYKNKILLRKHDKLNKWLSVGGHIELDEDPNEAAIREVKEEVGLDIELIGKKGDYVADDNTYFELVPPRYLGRNRLSPTHEHIVFVYFAKAKNDIINVQYESDRSDECIWVALGDLDNLDLIPDVKYYCREALVELSF
jgi:8-oxo-dGTP pyrophosphatase MutT (NUDIX family)